MAKSSFKLKLLINSASKKVLFAEANKEAVDFLFYILSLPLATVVKLLGKQAMTGSLTNLYQSLESLDTSYIQPNQSKTSILSPASASSIPLLRLANQPSDKKFYRCYSYCGYNVTDDPRAICPSCNRLMITKMPYVSPPPSDAKTGNGVGIVKEAVTYMVMDDLVIKPMSSISSITLLNKMNVKDLGILEEKVVNLGKKEGVKILSGMLKSKNVLTDVFNKGVRAGQRMKSFRTPYLHPRASASANSASVWKTSGMRTFFKLSAISQSKMRNRLRKIADSHTAFAK